MDICLEEEEEEEEEEEDDDNDDDDGDDDEDCGLVERSVSMYKSCSRRTDAVTDTAKRRKAQWRSNEKKKKKKKKKKRKKVEPSPFLPLDRRTPLRFRKQTGLQK